MDTAYMKERNYRQVMLLRYQNQREERILEKKLYSKHGVESAHKYHLSQIEDSEHSIKQELMKIRNTTTTTWGFLPPRPGKHGEKTAAHPDPFEKLFAAEKIMKKKKMKSHNSLSPAGSMQDLTKSFDHGHAMHSVNSQSPIKTAQSSPGKLEDIANIDIGRARNSVFSRLAQPKKYKNASQGGETVVHGKPPTGRNTNNKKQTSLKPHHEKSNTNSDGVLSIEIIHKDNIITHKTESSDATSIREVPKKSSLSKGNKSGATNVIIVNSDEQSKETADPHKGKQMSVNFAPHIEQQKQEVNEDENSDKANTHNTNDKNNDINVQDITNPPQKVKKTTDTSNAENTKRPRALTPIKETATEMDGNKTKKLNKQNSFARSITRGSSFYSSSKGSVTKKKAYTSKKEKSEVDENSKYNPDGSLRTVYSLPDFQKSIDEAVNARYLRMKIPVWYEREISVSEIWRDKDKPLKQKLKLK